MILQYITGARRCACIHACWLADPVHVVGQGPRGRLDITHFSHSKFAAINFIKIVQTSLQGQPSLDRCAVDIGGCAQGQEISRTYTGGRTYVSGHVPARLSGAAQTCVCSFTLVYRARLRGVTVANDCVCELDRMRVHDHEARGAYVCIHGNGADAYVIAPNACVSEELEFMDAQAALWLAGSPIARQLSAREKNSKLVDVSRLTGPPVAGATPRVKKSQHDWEDGSHFLCTSGAVMPPLIAGLRRNGAVRVAHASRRQAAATSIQ